MKILHIYKTYYPESLGGVEQFINTLSVGLHKKQVRSDILSTTSTTKNRIMEQGPQKIWFYPRTLDKFSCPVSWQFLKHFRKISHNYDILHYHFPWPFADLAHILQTSKKPSVVTYHSDIVKQKWLNKLYQPLMKNFLGKVSKIVTTSENLKQSSIALANFQNKTTTIPIGMAKPCPPINSIELREAFQKRFPQPFFLFVGVLRYYKGLSFLLKALRGTQIHLVIAGDGPEKNRLLKLKQEYLLENVHFLGKISDAEKWALYETCHAVVAPAHLRTEAFCISLLEGLMHNKPLISTELHTGTSFVNTDKITGLVVPKANPNALLKAMQQLLENASVYNTLQNNTESHYQNHFTEDNLVESYQEIYAELSS